MVEGILHDMSASGEFHAISLRYFNVAGADADGRIGQDYVHPTHLITRALKAAKGETEGLSIFGTDYPTHDGTCIRDYIHIDDIARAHVHALDYLMDMRKSDVMNCGYGYGFSVREVIDAVRKITGVDFPVSESGRRAGDPHVLVADSGKLKRLTGWTPRFDDLEYIVTTAWDWERNLDSRRHDLQCRNAVSEFCSLIRQNI
jgi:UDP-glucose 4-epimerase